MVDVGGKAVPVRRPLSTLDLPLLRAYVEAEVQAQAAPVHENIRARDEAWAKLQAGA